MLTGYLNYLACPPCNRMGDRGCFHIEQDKTRSALQIKGWIRGSENPNGGIV